MSCRIYLDLEKLLLHLQMELIDVQSSDILKTEWLLEMSSWETISRAVWFTTLVLPDTLFKNMFACILMLSFSLNIKTYNVLADGWLVTSLPVGTSHFLVCIPTEEKTLVLPIIVKTHFIERNLLSWNASFLI
jgi:hypothetical protein